MACGKNKSKKVRNHSLSSIKPRNGFERLTFFFYFLIWVHFYLFMFRFCAYSLGRVSRFIRQPQRRFEVSPCFCWEILLSTAKTTNTLLSTMYKSHEFMSCVGGFGGGVDSVSDVSTDRQYIHGIFVLLLMYFPSISLHPPPLNTHTHTHTRSTVFDHYVLPTLFHQCLHGSTL